VVLDGTHLGSHHHSRFLAPPPRPDRHHRWAAHRRTAGPASGATERSRHLVGMRSWPRPT